MARPSLHYIVPKSGRVCTTLSQRELKEVRKISIDLGVPESDVLKIAVLSLIEKYRNIDADELEKNGVGCFVSGHFAPTNESGEESGPDEEQ